MQGSETALIDAGCYASNRSCAISCTGDGEAIIRLGVALRIAQRVELLSMPLQDAADTVMGEVTAAGGKGGLIAISPGGEIAWSFNTPGMYRSQASSRKAREVGVFGKGH